MRQLEAIALDRDLPLLHRLEQRRLRLGGRAVDLVGEDHVREDGPRPERERAVARGEHVGAGDVGRQEIGRELDASHRCSRASAAKALTSVVLATPGTPSSST